jgi:hypothetical protein
LRASLRLRGRSVAMYLAVGIAVKNRSYIASITGMRNPEM